MDSRKSTASIPTDREHREDSEQPQSFTIDVGGMHTHERRRVGTPGDRSWGRNGSPSNRRYYYPDPNDETSWPLDSGWSDNSLIKVELLTMK